MAAFWCDIKWIFMEWVLKSFINFINLCWYLMSRKDILDKDLKTVLGKDVGAKNPIFSSDHIAELHAMFSCYADPMQRRATVRDILMTAKTLGMDQNYELVYRALEEMEEATGGHAIDFETFLRELTQKIGNPFTEEGRRANFTLLDVEGKGELTLDDMKYINEQLKYNFTEEHLQDIIHEVGGYGSDTIPFEKFNKIIQKKVARQRTQHNI